MAAEDIGNLVPTKIPALVDDADIQQALRLYHYGSYDFDIAETDPTHLINPSMAYTLTDIQDQIDTNKQTEIDARNISRVSDNVPVAADFSAFDTGIPDGYIWVDKNASAPAIYNSTAIYTSSAPTENLTNGLIWIKKGSDPIEVYSYNTTTSTWDEILEQGPSGVVNVNTPLINNGTSISADLGLDYSNGLTLDGTSLVIDAGKGLTFDSNALIVNYSTGLKTVSDILTVDYGTGLTVSDNSLIVDTGTGLTTSLNKITVDAGTGLTTSANKIIADLGIGLELSGNQITVDYGYGLTTSGTSIIVDNSVFIPSEYLRSYISGTSTAYDVFPRYAINTTAALSDGVAYLYYFTPFENITVNSITMACETAAVGTTWAKMGIYSVNSGTQNLTLVANTANTTTLFDTANTAYTVALNSSGYTVPYTLIKGQRYAVSVIVRGQSVNPTIVATYGSHYAAIASLSPRMIGYTSGNTDLPLTISSGNVLSSTDGCGWARFT